MKKWCLIVLVILFIPLVRAGISLNSDLADSYSLGDSIQTSFSLSSSNFEGIFKVILDCDQVTLDYSSSWVDLTDSSQNIDVVLPKITPSMEGDCNIEAKLVNSDNEVIDTFSSKVFSIKDELSVDIALEKETITPGDDLKIYFTINKDNFQSADAVISFDAYDETFTITEKEYTHTIDLAEDFKSKSHFAYLAIEDSFGNKLETDFNFLIEQIPTKIELIINQENLKPQETLEITSELYDQSKQLVEDTNIDIEIAYEDSEVIFSKSVDAGEKIEYTIDQYQAPGTYAIKAKSSDIQASKGITIESVEKIDVKIENGIITIRNIGNVPYNKKLDANLIGPDNKVYVIDQNVNLDPDGISTIDLSRLVRAGTYGVEIIPDEETKIEENATLDDNRPIYRKVSQDVFGAGITGAAITDIGSGKINSSYSIIFLVLVIGMVLFFYLKKKNILPKVNIKVADKQKDEDISHEVSKFLEKKTQEPEKPKNSVEEMLQPKTEEKPAQVIEKAQEKPPVEIWEKQHMTHEPPKQEVNKEQVDSELMSMAGNTEENVQKSSEEEKQEKYVDLNSIKEFLNEDIEEKEKN